MDIKKVKSNLNKSVLYTSQKSGINSEYILTACIIRRSKKSFFYQVELQDKKSKCIIIASLEDIHPA